MIRQQLYRYAINNWRQYWANAWYINHMLTVFGFNAAIFIGKDKEFTTSGLNLFHIGFEFIEHVIFRCENDHRHVIVD
ncbi:hypothetical protein D3C71_1994820 [compost metagenome]